MTDLGLPFGTESRTCPACGAEDGLCGPRDGSEDHPGPILFREWGTEYVPPKPRSLDMNAVVATARIFEKVPIPRSDRTSKVLRFTPGNVIPGDVAERLNVGADGTQSSIPTADAEATSAVPLTPTPTKAAQKAAPAKKVAKAKSAAKTTKKASKAAKKG